GAGLAGDSFPVPCTRHDRLRGRHLQRLRFDAEPGPGTVGAGLAGDSFPVPCTLARSPARQAPTAASFCRGAWAGHCRSRPCRRFLLAGCTLYQPPCKGSRILPTLETSITLSTARSARASTAAAVDPALDRDVRPGLELQVALFRVRVVVIHQSAFDIDRVGIVALDEIAVIAVHRPYQVCQ